MVFNPTGVRGEPDYILVNPRVIKSSNTADVSEEGCLSFPNIYGDVQVRTWSIHSCLGVRSIVICALHVLNVGVWD